MTEYERRRDAYLDHVHKHCGQLITMQDVIGKYSYLTTTNCPEAKRLLKLVEETIE